MHQPKTRMKRILCGEGRRTTEVLGRNLRRAACGTLAAALVAGATACSSQPKPVVPTRAEPSATLVLGAVSDDCDSSRLDALLGAVRAPAMRETESVEYRVWDRQREFDGRPMNTYRATTVTRERRTR